MGALPGYCLTVGLSGSDSRSWRVTRRTGDPAELLGGASGQPPDQSSGRQVTLCRLRRPALVLGSTQADAVVDRDRLAAAGVDAARRPSGGGAVMVVPGQLAWAEVHIERADPLWEADVGRAFWWLGEAWAAALARLGAPAPEVHHGPLVGTPWASLVCFGGLGAGEVTLGGTKVVGLSQRRTREGATFSCAALLDWEPEALLDLLALDTPRRQQGRRLLNQVATGLRPWVDGPGDLALEAVEDSFVRCLPQEGVARPGPPAPIPDGPP